MTRKSSGARRAARSTGGRKLDLLDQVGALLKQHGRPQKLVVQRGAKEVTVVIQWENVEEEPEEEGIGFSSPGSPAVVPTETDGEGE